MTSAMSTLRSNQSELTARWQLTLYHKSGDPQVWLGQVTWGVTFLLAIVTRHAITGLRVRAMLQTPRACRANPSEHPLP